MVSDAEARAARALATQARMHPANPLRDPRALVSPVAHWRKTQGTCPWCHEPSAEREPSWHPWCRRYYYAARGNTHYDLAGKRIPLIARTPCAQCGNEAQEIDHIVPLAAARKLMNRAAMLQAWTPHNLQWLCTSCHTAKTTANSQHIQSPMSDRKAIQLSLF